MITALMTLQMKAAVEIISGLLFNISLYATNIKSKGTFITYLSRINNYFTPTIDML